MKLVVTIPAYNEQKTIGRVIEEIPRSIPGIDVIEIVVIDDGSSDETVQRATACGADYVISHRTNLGLAQAFMTGIKQAISLDADVIANTDGDFQYDQRQIPLLVEPIINETADIVLGSRFKGYIEEMPLRKKLGNQLATYVTGVLSGFRTSDAQSGFRAYNKKAAEALYVHGKRTYVQETIIRPARMGFRIVEVPISFRKRDGSSRLIKSIWGYALAVMPYMLYSYIDAIRTNGQVAEP